MASRKSIMHPRVEELGGMSPSSRSPLRRRSSIIEPSTASVSLEVENDDEAELRIRRREKNTPQVGQSSDRRRSLGLGFVSQMTNPQIAEKVQQCIQLSVENKISVKNAFSLQMIDFMTYMIKKRDANMNNLQVASTSLDVSTKIYGLRVDRIHTDILKMSGGLDKQDRNEGNRDGEAIEERGNATGDPDEEVQARERAKKKRRCKQKIIASVESLRGPTETVNPASLMMGGGDAQTTDKLYLATMSYQADSGLDLHLSNDVLLDTVNPEKPVNNNNNKSVSCRRIGGDLRKLELCSSFAKFEMLGWSVNDEPEELSPLEPTPVENGFQFDLDASLPPENEVSNAGINFFDVEDDENVEGCERVAQAAANIVDFRETLEAPSSKQNFEYSYFQDNMDIQWAGPSHWKIRHPSKNLAASRIVGRCEQEPIKRNKEVNLAFNDDSVDSSRASFENTRGNSVKLQAKTAKTGWTEEKITLPQDMHYNASETCKYYLSYKLLENPWQRKDLMNATHVSDDVGDYDYNNENDNDYCPNIAGEDQHDLPESALDHVRDFEEVANLGTQPFTGDNLVELPKMTNEIVLAYTQRAKKIDMRQLKKCIWKNLLQAGEVDKENVHAERPENREKINGAVEFSRVFEDLPKTLSKNNIEALSLPVAFMSLLHLANEKTLQIDPVDDKSDLLIRQG